MAGALVMGNTSKRYGLIAGNTVPSSRVDFISALTGSLSVATAKVVLNLLPRFKRQIFNPLPTLEQVPFICHYADGGGYFTGNAPDVATVNALDALPSLNCQIYYA